VSFTASFTLNMGPEWAPETLLSYNKTTRRYNLEYFDLKNRVIYCQIQTFVNNHT